MQKKQLPQKKAQSVSAGFIITTIVAVLAVQILLRITGLSSVLMVLIAALLTSLVVTLIWSAMGKFKEK